MLLLPLVCEAVPGVDAEDYYKLETRRGDFDPEPSSIDYVRDIAIRPRSTVEENFPSMQAARAREQGGRQAVRARVSRGPRRRGCRRLPMTQWVCQNVRS